VVVGQRARLIHRFFGGLSAAELKSLQYSHDAYRRGTALVDAVLSGFAARIRDSIPRAEVEAVVAGLELDDEATER
jgi:hypothetical protein